MKNQGIAGVLKLIIALILIAFIFMLGMPYFTGPSTLKDADGNEYEEVATYSIMGYLGFPQNHTYMQDEGNLDGKPTVVILGIPVLLIAFGVAGAVTSLKGKGVGSMFFPLLWGLVGIIGIFQSRFMSLYNVSSTYFIYIAVFIVELILVGFTIYLLIQKKIADRKAGIL